MPSLSPKLAQQDPERFGAELIGGLKDRTVYGSNLWEAVVSASLISEDNLHVDSKTWGSRSNAQRGEVHLGAAAFSEQQRDQLIFNQADISYEDEVTLRLLHELGRLFEASRITADSELIQDLLRTTRAVRSVNQNLGLSAIGSLSFYGADMKFREDAAELTAMYSFDPSYLKNFLGYVNTAESKPLLNSVGIATIPGYGNELFNLVEDTIQEGIARN